MAQFAPVPGAAPGPPMSGILQLQHLAARSIVHRDRFTYLANTPELLREFPTMELSLQQVDGWLLPRVTGPLAESTRWQIMIRPGRIWQHTVSQQRASLAFALLEPAANCVHNGVIHLRFDGDERIAAQFEIASETCAYFQFDWWGVLDAQFVRAPLAPDSGQLAAFSQWQKRQLPTENLQAAQALNEPRAWVDEDLLVDGSITTYGLFDQGVHYRGGCPTRYGEYPVCEQLVLPSYSVAKSLLLGVGALRVARENPALLEANVAALVQPCAGLPQWRDVTLENLLDMTTGNYASAGYMTDESAQHFENFLLAATVAEKAAYACQQFPRQKEPGSYWVYHSSDSFLAAMMMQRFHGQADFFSAVLIDGIYAALGLSEVTRGVQRTDDAQRQFYGAYGWYFLTDDLLRIAQWLRSEDAGEVLDPALLAQALQRGGVYGVAAGAEDVRYRLGFWALNAARHLGCTNPLWIPFLSGYGGITVALLPDGRVYYVFADHGQHQWLQALTALDKQRALCERRNDRHEDSM